MIASTRRLHSGTGRIVVAAAFLLGAATMTYASTKRPMLRIPNAQIEPVAWSAVEGWTEDNHAEAFAAYYKSCETILRGTKAGDIPMEQPTTYELAINAATVRKLGIRIPESIRIRVDRVIDH